MPFQFDADKVVRSPWVAGALGAVVALKGAPGVSWPERAFNVFCGLLVAGNLSPALCEQFGLLSPAMQGATAFFLGLFGMNLVAAIVGWIKETKLADLVPWFRKDRR